LASLHSQRNGLRSLSGLLRAFFHSLGGGLFFCVVQGHGLVDVSAIGQSPNPRKLYFWLIWHFLSPEAVRLLADFLFVFFNENFIFNVAIDLKRHDFD
jgi:hypothetical protein